ncbi:hypothetical protein PoB_001825700 [Plakobranchus ocellatus]|uniref:Uncharacterized protein n=1 Tax=Plakobranchus ocellatus TaxID=259542 RepID=A0AAV3ZB95_9GAST|nr:hypothetical protein PoB_001825700 [Plakobranchus ocellatus]
MPPALSFMEIPAWKGAEETPPIDRGDIGMGIMTECAGAEEDKEGVEDDGQINCDSEEVKTALGEDSVAKRDGVIDAGVVENGKRITPGGVVEDAEVDKDEDATAKENPDPGLDVDELGEGKASLVIQLARWFSSLVFSSISSSLFESRYLLTSCAQA